LFWNSRKQKKLFVKYAGAKTLEYSGDVNDATIRLMNSVPLYETLKHDALITLIDSFCVSGGFATVFKWFNGKNLHPHWEFPPPAKYTNPDSPFFKFKHLPIHLRLKALDSIFDFHLHVEHRGYTAIDFYDGSLLYNFINNKIKICDIDFYKKNPYVNTMEKLWGSTRFMSPEEFVKGAVIDEKTNVYNMGATAFCLIGGEMDRTLKKWDGPEDLFYIAQKATKDDRNKRYSSVHAFCQEWKRVRSCQS